MASLACNKQSIVIIIVIIIIVIIIIIIIIIIIMIVISFFNLLGIHALKKYSRTPLYGRKPLNTRTSLLRTVFFVRRERKPQQIS